MPQILSDRDAARLQDMLRWFDSQTDTRYQRRRPHGRGGGNGSTTQIAYCKTDSPDSDEIDCYLGTDLAAWNSVKIYAKNDWVEVSGTEYRSVDDNNVGHTPGEAAWWEDGTKSVTVKCLIINGSSLMYAQPFLNDGDPILVGYVIIDGVRTLTCTNIEFNGAVFTS